MSASSQIPPGADPPMSWRRLRESYIPCSRRISFQVWNEAKLVKDEIEYAIQINNKIVTKMNFANNAENSEIEKLVVEDDKIKTALNGKNVVKIIVIKNRLVNIIAK